MSFFFFWGGRGGGAIYCFILFMCKNCGPLSQFKTYVTGTFFKALVVIGQVGMTSLQVNCSLTEVNASVFTAVF